jgi:hypothetical protein
MAPMITLYILGGCVAAAVLLFIVMIVLSALRPPQLPELSVDAPPLERFMRALTPAPIAGAPGMQPAYARAAAVPPRTRPPSPPPAAIKQPAPPAAAVQPQVQPPVVAPPSVIQPVIAPPSAIKPVVALPPVVKPAPPVVAQAPATRPAPSHAATRPASAAPAARAPRPPVAFTRPPYAAPAAFARPVYPARRGRKLLRGFAALLLTTTLVAGTVVAYPALIDPLCDDYVWFGADAAAVIREHAREANVVLADLIYTALGH